jgi:hypothetical protein
MTVGLSALPDGRTLVQIGDVDGSLWELSQEKEEPAEAGPAGGLQAADFPVLAGARPAAFDAIDERIEIQIEGSTLASAAERFTQALAERGWKVSDGGIRDEDYTLLNFSKEGMEITLRARLQNGAAVVSFRGDGLLWSKELPAGKAIVSYERWLRQNKLPAQLELLDRYEAEMRAIDGSAAAE